MKLLLFFSSLVPLIAAFSLFGLIWRATDHYMDGMRTRELGRLVAWSWLVEIGLFALFGLSIWVAAASSSTALHATLFVLVWASGIAVAVRYSWFAESVRFELPPEETR